MSVAHPSIPAGWFRALTLGERLAWRLPATLPSSTARGVRRLATWRADGAFGADNVVQRRLDGAGLTEDQLAALLDEPDDALRSRTASPGWLTDLALSDRTPFPLPDSVRQRAEHGFLEVAAAFLGRAWDTLCAGVSGARAIGEPRDLAALLFEEPVHAVLNLLCRPLVLELHVAKLAGTLEGATPEARFQSFVDRYRSDDAVRALLEEYPVLARSIAVTLDRAVESRLEFLRRLTDDRDLLHQTFAVPADGDPLVAVKEAGDPHRGGRTVLIATFRSGARLVYKPKPLAADRHLQGLLRWVNDHGFQPPFREIRIVDRGEWGWQEFLVNDRCDSPDGVGRFYRRTGGLLAILHTIAGTDVHFENLVAVGEHPMLIDAETVFHPSLIGDGADPGTAQVNADIAASVLGVGLLPERTTVPGGGSVDLSGIGASAAQQSPQDVTRWVDVGTDTMRLGRKRMPMPAGEHAPSIDGEPTGYAEHADRIADGFTDVYRILAVHRDALLDGPIATFADAPIRVILRPTQRYATLYRDSGHPDLLRDALDRDHHFDRLWRDTALRPELRPVVAAEQGALQWGDIPMFTTTPASRDLLSGTGERFPSFLPESGLDAVRRRVHELGDAHLARQLWYVRAALAAGAPRATRRPSPEPIVAATALDGARAIAVRLEALACRGGGFASWVGENTSPDGHTSIRPVGCELYAGTSGIALFLAALRAETGDDRHLPLLTETVATLRAQVERRAGADGIGAFTGWGGVVHTLCQLGRWLADPTLLALAETVAASLGDTIDADTALDVIGGAAGCALSLLTLHAATGSPTALTFARRCGDRLVATARPAGPGVGWTVPGVSEGPLGGLAHGAAGIALALRRLGTVTGEVRYTAIADAALRYERTLCDEATGRWADLRSATHDDAPGAWCHGAPGIGLARLAGGWDDPEARAEIALAVARTLADGFGFNESLCHGALGNVELVAVAGHTFARSDWTTAASDAVAAILARWASHGPTTGVLGGLASPGLMTGLAGLGYGLLRAHAPERVPSVLVLDGVGR